jgi:hypothetical protein
MSVSVRVLDLTGDSPTTDVAPTQLGESMPRKQNRVWHRNSSVIVLDNVIDLTSPAKQER